MNKVGSEGIAGPHVTLAGTHWRYGPATLENEAEMSAWWRCIQRIDLTGAGGKP